MYIWQNSFSPMQSTQAHTNSFPPETVYRRKWGDESHVGIMLANRAIVTGVGKGGASPWIAIAPLPAPRP